MTKILLVEDDKSLREIYGVRLLAEGYDIVSAGDGEEALAMAIKEKPTLIISDVMMPKISGFDMLDILRSTTETRDIKVIMMTALSSDDQRTRGEQLGADKYLVKSQVGIEDVVRTVHEVLEDAPGGATPAAPAPAANPEPAAPAVAAAAPADEPADDTTAPVAAAASPADPVDLAAAAPGNDGAGPLPPQPTESTLPQPTAPFTSPRPANLGERVVQPLPSTEESGVTAEEIARELQASAEPVANSQVDEAISDADLASGASVAPLGDAPIEAPADLTTEPVAIETAPTDTIVSEAPIGAATPFIPPAPNLAETSTEAPEENTNQQPPVSPVPPAAPLA